MFSAKEKTTKKSKLHGAKRTIRRVPGLPALPKREKFSFKRLSRKNRHLLIFLSVFFFRFSTLSSMQGQNIIIFP
jgi:hypothetical protein